MQFGEIERNEFFDNQSKLFSDLRKSQKKHDNVFVPYEGDLVPSNRIAGDFNSNDPFYQELLADLNEDFQSKEKPSKREDMQTRLLDSYKEGFLLCFMALNEGKGNYPLLQVPNTTCMRNYTGVGGLNKAFKEGQVIYVCSHLAKEVKNAINLLKKDKDEFSMITEMDKYYIKYLKGLRPKCVIEEEEGSYRNYNVFLTIPTFFKAQKEIVKRIIVSEFYADPEFNLKCQTIALRDLESIASENVKRRF